MHVRSFTRWRISSADMVTCQWRNAPLYRAVLSLDLKVSVDTVMSEITVSGRLFQIMGEAWQKALLEKLTTAGCWHREIVAVLESRRDEWVLTNTVVAELSGLCKWAMQFCIQSCNGQEASVGRRVPEWYDHAYAFLRPPWLVYFGHAGVCRCSCTKNRIGLHCSSRVFQQPRHKRRFQQRYQITVYTCDEELCYDNMTTCRSCLHAGWRRLYPRLLTQSDVLMWTVPVSSVSICCPAHWREVVSSTTALLFSWFRHSLLQSSQWWRVAGHSVNSKNVDSHNVEVVMSKSQNVANGNGESHTRAVQNAGPNRCEKHLSCVLPVRCF